jgi:8-oxo-dGTP diphosphatase
MVTFATLCYLQAAQGVLLLRKAAGLFGGGRWNAPGGKLLSGELPERGAIREMLEETALAVSSLRFHGLLNFYVGVERKLDQVVFLFSCEKYVGDLQPSSEGELRWFPLDKIPYAEMWEDDRFWLPLLLEGRRFVGDFYFTGNYDRLVDQSLQFND